MIPYLTEENLRKHKELTSVDSLVWASTQLPPTLEIAHKVDSAVIHPTCSMRHLDDVEHLQAIAAACADEVDTPVYAECCGFAGDRGMLHKELTESAAKHEAHSADGPSRAGQPRRPTSGPPTSDTSREARERRTGWMVEVGCRGAQRSHHARRGCCSIRNSVLSVPHRPADLGHRTADPADQRHQAGSARSAP